MPADEIDRLAASGPPRTSEIIDGGRGEIWLTEAERTYYTGATWTAPAAVHLRGQARDRRSAQLHLAIYRTVRFTGR